MTEFTDRVEKRRIELDAKEWGNGLRYLHYNNGVEEIRYQNGDAKFTEVESGKVKWTYGKLKTDLVSRYLRWRQDQRKEEW
jgi:hypothetical protein